MDNENSRVPKNINVAKIVVYVISILFTLLICYNSHAVSSLKFFLKALIYIITFAGGVLGGHAGTWMNAHFPYPINWVAGKLNLQDSYWFKLLGAQIIGVIAGGILGAGIMANILNIKL